MTTQTTWRLAGSMLFGSLAIMLITAAVGALLGLVVGHWIGGAVAGAAFGVGLVVATVRLGAIDARREGEQ